MSDVLRFKLTFESDWHVGEGAGAEGHIDAIVRRHPEDDLPYVPAKTLTGILRDACERIAHGLDESRDNGPWHQLLREVFGGNAEDPDPSMRFASFSLGPARFNDALREAIRSNAGLKDALVFIKPGVKLDEAGVAASQMLRFEEVVLAGAELYAEGALKLHGEHRATALALLAAGTKAVERLGAKRRRGYGRCRLILENAPPDTKIIERLTQPPPSATNGEAGAAQFLLVEPVTDDTAQWHVLALELDLRSPVIVPAETLGNVVSTRDHIPGSLILPAINAWLRCLLGDRTTSALASGRVQVRNAYPLLNEERLLPVPAALFKLKEGNEYTNHLHGELEDNQQRKQQRAGYVGARGLPFASNNCSGTSVTGRPMEVETLAATHATIHDESQRPTSEVGGVFTYEAIRPRQRLLAQLWIAKSSAAELPDEWLELCPKAIRIGRSKKDDYGRVALSCREVQPQGPDASGNSLTVWLTSPLLLRNQALSPVTDAETFATTLSKALGVKLQKKHAFIRTWRDEGWNNAWQTARPSRFGLAPGSCFLFSCSEAIPPQTLKCIQAQGLGERRGEGYGEILFNAPLLEKPDVPLGEVPTVKNAVSSGADRARRQLTQTDFTKALQHRAARLMIQCRVVERDKRFRESLAWRGGDRPMPPNTQLGALRALIEGLRDTTGLERLGGWLAAVEGNQRRNDKWPSACKDILREQVTNPSRAWAWVDGQDIPPTLPDHNCEALKHELRFEAMRTLWLTAISRQLDDNEHQAQRITKEANRHGA